MAGFFMGCAALFCLFLVLINTVSIIAMFLYKHAKSSDIKWTEFEKSIMALILVLVTTSVAYKYVMW